MVISTFYHVIGLKLFPVCWVFWKKIKVKLARNVQFLFILSQVRGYFCFVRTELVVTVKSFKMLTNVSVSYKVYHFWLSFVNISIKQKELRSCNELFIEIYANCTLKCIIILAL